MYCVYIRDIVITPFIWWAQLFCVFFGSYSQFIESQDSSVGIDARYGLDFPGIESRWGGRDFPHPPILTPGPTQPPVQGVQALFPRGKAACPWL
jgi:hypothetical protein